MYTQDPMQKWRINGGGHELLKTLVLLLHLRVFHWPAGPLCARCAHSDGRSNGDRDSDGDRDHEMVMGERDPDPDAVWSCFRSSIINTLPNYVTVNLNKETFNITSLGRRDDSNFPHAKWVGYLSHITQWCQQQQQQQQHAAAAVVVVAVVVVVVVVVGSSSSSIA